VIPVIRRVGQPSHGSSRWETVDRRDTIWGRKRFRGPARHGRDRDALAGAAIPVRGFTAALPLDGGAIVERLMDDLSSPEDRVWLVIDDLHERSTDARRQLELLLRSERTGGQISVIENTVPSKCDGPPPHTREFDERPSTCSAASSPSSSRTR
jgi:hypothetical protein